MNTIADTVKFVFDGDCRRINFKNDESAELTFEQLSELLYKEFDGVIVPVTLELCDSVPIVLKYADSEGDMCTLSVRSFGDWFDSAVKVQRTLQVVADPKVKGDCIVGYCEAEKTKEAKAKEAQPSKEVGQCAKRQGCGMRRPGMEGQQWRRGGGCGGPGSMKGQFLTALMEHCSDNWRADKSGDKAKWGRWGGMMTGMSAMNDRSDRSGTCGKSFAPPGPRPLMAMMRVIAQSGGEIDADLMCAVFTHFLPLHLKRVNFFLGRIRRQIQNKGFDDLKMQTKKFLVVFQEVVASIAAAGDDPHDTESALYCVDQLQKGLEAYCASDRDARLVMARTMAEKLTAKRQLLKRFLLNSDFLSCADHLTTDDILHHNVTCDNCKTNEFVGLRFKCNECEDFDLCAKCYASSECSHDWQHAFGGLLPASLKMQRMKEGSECKKSTTCGATQEQPPHCRGGPWRKQWASRDAYDLTGSKCCNMRTMRCGGGAMTDRPRGSPAWMAATKGACTERPAQPCWRKQTHFSGDETQNNLTGTMRPSKCEKRREMTSSDEEDGCWRRRMMKRSMWQKQHPCFTGLQSGDDLPHPWMLKKMRREAMKREMMTTGMSTDDEAPMPKLFRLRAMKRMRHRQAMRAMMSGMPLSDVEMPTMEDSMMMRKLRKLRRQRAMMVAASELGPSMNNDMMMGGLRRRQAMRGMMGGMPFSDVEIPEGSMMRTMRQLRRQRAMMTGASEFQGPTMNNDMMMRGFHRRQAMKRAMMSGFAV